MFVIHTLTARAPIFDKEMFADRNFSVGMLFMAVNGVLLLAGLALLPPLLQHLYGYSVLQSGLLTAPRGVGTLIAMLVALLMRPSMLLMREPKATPCTLADDLP